MKNKAWRLTSQSTAWAKILLEHMPTPGRPRIVYPTELLGVAQYLGLLCLLRDGIEVSVPLQEQVDSLLKAAGVEAVFGSDGALSSDAFGKANSLAASGWSGILNRMMGSRIEATGRRVEIFLRALDLPVSISMLADSGWVARMNVDSYTVTGQSETSSCIEGRGAQPINALVNLHDQLVGAEVCLITSDSRPITVPIWPRLNDDDALREVVSGVSPESLSSFGLS